MTLRKWTRPANPARLVPWMDLEALAEVEVSSEDPQWPIDGALIEGDGRGWRAAAPGEQKLRIRFEAPQSLGVIHLVFEEAEYERVQEFALQWSPDRGRTFHALVRQQFTFQSGWSCPRDGELRRRSEGCDRSRTAHRSGCVTTTAGCHIERAEIAVNASDTVNRRVRRGESR